MDTQAHQQTTIARRARVAELKAAGNTVPQIVALFSAEGVINPKTGGAYTPKTIREDYRMADAVVTEVQPSRAPTVMEMIGRDWYVTPAYHAHRHTTTIDRYRSDYEFWDKLRRCKADGYELSGLFCNPLTDTFASYVIGDAPVYTLVDDTESEVVDPDVQYTNQEMERFITYNLAALIVMVSDMYALGDQFVFMNPDGTLSIPSPDSVIVEFDPFNYRRIVRAVIKTRWSGHEVEDTYTDTQRVIRYKKGGSVVREEVYDNLIGRIPLVHFPNDRRANELFGRPIYEAMLSLLANYNDLLDKAMQGVRLMGNPIPTFEGMENIRETVAANAVPQNETYADVDGIDVERTTIAFDEMGAVFVGKGGKFDFKSPQIGFTEDMRRMLKQLFLLLCDHTRFPEFLWGGAVEASKASTETQMPPFVRYIDMRRALLDGQPMDERIGIAPSGGMYDLMNLFLRMRKLTDPRIVVGRVRSRWQSVALMDARLTFEKVMYARGIGGLTMTTAVDLLDIVPDAKLETERAEAEAPEEELDTETMMNRVARRDAQPGVTAPQADGLSKAKPNASNGGRDLKIPMSETVAEMLTAMDHAVPGGLDGGRLAQGKRKKKRNAA